jgi:hypothetical protein
MKTSNLILAVVVVIVMIPGIAFSKYKIDPQTDSWGGDFSDEAVPRDAISIILETDGNYNVVESSADFDIIVEDYHKTYETRNGERYVVVTFDLKLLETESEAFKGRLSNLRVEFKADNATQLVHYNLSRKSGYEGYIIGKYLNINTPLQVLEAIVISENLRSEVLSFINEKIG